MLFVDQTKGGKLAKELREIIKRLEGIIGFGIKVVERTGSKLKNILSNTNPWAGSTCGREECVTCSQDSEEKPPCTKRSLVYESICLKCNPEAKKKGPLENMNMAIPSIYVGETARSVQERSREHWEGYRRKDNDNHMVKHMTLHHEEGAEPEFLMKVVGFHRTALSRQVGEAVRIAKRGLVLNSKAEFSRCNILRLSLEQVSQDQQFSEASDLGREQEEHREEWTDGLLRKRDKLDRFNRSMLGMVKLSGSKKRENKEPKTPRRVKRRKFNLIGEEGGLVVEEKEEPREFLYSGADRDMIKTAHGENRKITEWAIKKVSKDTDVQFIERRLLATGDRVG